MFLLTFLLLLPFHLGTYFLIYYLLNPQGYLILFVKVKAEIEVEVEIDSILISSILLISIFKEKLFRLLED